MLANYTPTNVCTETDWRVFSAFNRATDNSCQHYTVMGIESELQTAKIATMRLNLTDQPETRITSYLKSGTNRVSQS
jgi:hypothetical protein